MWLGNEATEMNGQSFTAGILPGRAAVRIAGAEARHFLHNLLTADIEALQASEARYGALLTPQGKILFDLFIFDAGSSFLLDCAHSQMADLVKRLTFYKLRARVEISAEDNLAIGVSPVEPTEAMGFRDPRVAAIGWRFFGPSARADHAAGYDSARIFQGLADTDADLGSGEFFPHEANLDQLGALSFTKGCYVGQEVVSRMEHRGLARSRMLPVRLGGAAPAKGSDIRSGEKLVGSLLSSSGDMALALLRLDRLAEASAPLLTGAVSVEVMKPAWVRYDVPGAKDMA